ncbi:MAG: glycosyl transferase [Prolixibacteraceae bacterium]|nr:glycosyl transferase [Prolixibacteraceae bacterium]
MKILYAIQGTGNGHLARATEIVPYLRKIAETDVLISGIQGDIEVPFSVQYRFYGISFIFGTRGGVNLWKTLIKLRPIRFIKDIRKLPVDDYDLVICDFEPVTAWACKLRKKKCVGLSHQIAVLHPKAPKPKNTSWIGRTILNYYAPVSIKYGFHFDAIHKTIFTPVIRSTIRNARHINNGHYTVYLPSYSNDEIESVLLTFPQVQWQVFSKHSKKSYRSGNVLFQPVSLDAFTKSFVTCEGILCNAGFETPAEAIYMGKKLCVIPMKNQYEQQCNAAFLSSMGVLVLPKLRNQYNELEKWLYSSEKILIRYPHYVKKILAMIVNEEVQEISVVQENKEKINFLINATAVQSKPEFG